MKLLAQAAALVVVFSLPTLASAVEYTEDEVLHATFAAFQTPGVLSADYIAEQRTLLQTAARSGNAEAQLVLERHGDALNGKSSQPLVILADNPR